MPDTPIWKLETNSGPKLFYKNCAGMTYVSIFKTRRQWEGGSLIMCPKTSRTTGSVRQEKINEKNGKKAWSKLT